MKVTEINFGNIDLAYVIKYEDNHDLKMLGSNDPANDDLTNAKTILDEAVRNYAAVSEIYASTVTVVTWRDEKVSFKFNEVKIAGWPKRKISCNTSVTYAGKRETDVEPERLAVLDAAEELRKEVENYLMGMRMQKELPFQE